MPIESVTSTVIAISPAVTRIEKIFNADQRQPAKQNPIEIAHVPGHLVQSRQKAEQAGRGDANQLRWNQPRVSRAVNLDMMPARMT